MQMRVCKSIVKTVSTAEINYGTVYGLLKHFNWYTYRKDNKIVQEIEEFIELNPNIMVFGETDIMESLENGMLKKLVV